jgi:hypothetical protein
LSTIGGTWDEPFDLPADPELVMQRTGYACLDEFGFPPNSAFEESVYYFYDQTCQVETPATSACHVTQFPTDNARQKLLVSDATSRCLLRFGSSPGRRHR